MRGRVRGYVIGGLALAALVLWPLAADRQTSAGDEATEGPTITDYRGSFVVDDEGTMSVTETLTVEFPDSTRHGIFRFFDSRDPNAPGLRRVPEKIDVLVDGGRAPEQPAAETEVTREGRAGRYTDLRIGSPDEKIPAGEHVYEISYRMSSVLQPDGDRSTFYWNLIPSGWRLPIEHATLSLTLPALASDVRCAVGEGPFEGCSTTAGPDGTDLEITTGPLDPGTPVTVRTGLDMAAPPASDEVLPWPQAWDPVMGADLTMVAVLLALTVGFAVPAVYVLVRTRDPLPPAQPRAMPPDGVGPAQVAYIISKRARPTLLAAGVLYAASRGLATIRSTQNGWRVRVDEDAAWDRIDTVTRRVRKLDGVAIGASRKSRAAKAAGWKLSEARVTMRKDLESWAIRRKLLERRTDRGVWHFLFWPAAIATILLAFVRPGGTALCALVPGVFAVLIIPVLPEGAGLVRTDAGRRLAAEALGFSRTLRAQSDRFDGDQALYDSELPWAVGFGITDEWARRVSVTGAAALAVPAYLAYTQVGGNAQPAAADGGGLVSTLADDFEQSLGSAIRSYEISSTFSSDGLSGSGGNGASFSGGGGGGGGFGGGGGGDGGGGSW
ncbi:DUF2207 domain-containing protein [Nocardioides sp. NPDC126508]